MRIDGWTLLLQALNLALLVALLRWLFYRPLLRVIDERRRVAADEVAHARATQQQAEQRVQALADERAAFEASREALLQAARAETERERQAARAQAGHDAERALADARRRAADEQHAAAQALFDDAAALACALAQRLLQATPAGGDAGFVDALLERVRSTPAAEREAWFAAGSARTATLASAHALVGAAQARAAAALHTLLGDDVGITFATEASLLAGAELRFAHGTLAFHWAGELAAARAALAAAPAP